MRKKTILISSNMPKVRFEKIFFAQYIVLSANSAHETWESVKNNKIDLIIMDEEIRGFGELNMLGKLKSVYPHIPVIITSENPSYKSCLSSFRSGARDYFGKPYDFDLILNVAEKIISSREGEIYWGKNCYYVGLPSDLYEIGTTSTHFKNKRGIETAFQYLLENFTNDLHKENLVRIAQTSYTHFSRLFKRYTGFSYIEYLTRLRIEKAKELLKLHNLNITEICFAVGYHNLAHFERIFRKKVGCSPREYRNTNRKFKQKGRN